MNIGNKIRQRRCELGMSQRDLAEKMGYNNHSTIAKIENGTVDIPHSRIIQFASVLNITVESLMEPKADIATTQTDIVEDHKPNNREVFSANLRLLMAKTGKSRKDVSEAIGVSYFTFSDWCNGKKYPRVEKMERLANYFGISISELVGNNSNDSHNTVSPATTQNEILDIILRLHTDSEFLLMVEKMSRLDNEKLKALKQFLSAFGK